MEALFDTSIAIFVYALAFALVFSVHELGHFVTARLFGIKVTSVSVGYGKRLWSFTDKHGTEWVFRLFCLAGYIQLSGGDRFEKRKIDRPAFSRLSLLKRFLTVLAGPAANFILPAFLLVPAYFFFGQPSYQPVVTAIEAGQVAERAGFKIGDKIIQIDETKISRNRETRKIFKKLPPKELHVIVERDDQEVDLNITPYEIEYTDYRGQKKHHGRIGVFLTNIPGHLYYIEAVDGIETGNNIDRARALLIERFDKDVLLTVQSDMHESGVADYYIHLQGKHNQDLLDPSAKHYNSYFTGTREYGFYKELSFKQSLSVGLKEAKDTFLGVITLPLQLFPVDRDKLRPHSRPAEDYSITKYWIFVFIYTASLLSVVIGYINMLPFPNMDGSFLLFYASEAIKGPEFVAQKKGLLIALSLFLLYMTALSCNINGVIPYLKAGKERIVRKAEMVMQTMDDKHTAPISIPKEAE